MDFTNLVFYFIIIVPSAIIHEVAHGFMAEWLGDPTARYAGRLTVDPRVHVDLFGTILLPLLLSFSTGGTFMFAYAKPVPYNPYNLRNQKWGPALVGLAGPAANLLLATTFALAVRVASNFAIAPFLVDIVIANVGLAIFNLVPIPPLDGSKILYAVLPDSMQGVKLFLDRYGMMIVLFFVLFLSQLIAPSIYGISRWLLGSGF